MDDFLTVALPGRTPVEYGEDDEWAEMFVPVVAKFELQQDLRQVSRLRSWLRSLLPDFRRLPMAPR